MIVRGRSGEKQGPLLMGDDFEAELIEIIGKGMVNPKEGVALAKALEGFNLPRDGDWRMPDPPEAQDAMVVSGREAKGYPCEKRVLYLPPFPSSCRTDALGTGLQRAGELDRNDHGSFNLMVSAGPGQYSYAMASPCNHYRAPTDGWLKIDFSLIIWGQGIVAVDKGGKAELEIGVFAAHCHPKEAGKYWQEPGITIKAAGRERYENRLLHHTAYFSVKQGVDYSFGTGVTAKAWAWGNAAAGVRLWGRQAHAVFMLTNKGPVKKPY